MRDVQEAPSREVESSGYAEEVAFRITADHKMFRILIAGLYADKPRAIVREIWSNAFDSHAQKSIADRPFECHLPTRFAPHFSVRDFGVGLTHDQVMGLYSTVGASTKEMTNLAVGKFGLGSKTPFAYSDQFALTCWLSGEKRLYNAFISASGVPTIALFHREPSTEEDGVEVSFPVQPCDADAFLRAARTIVLGFDLPPVLTGAQIDLERDLGKVVLTGNGWVLRKNEYGRDANTAHIRQGCVVYPLDRGALASAFAHESQIVSALLDSALIFDVPIGSVDITPSRESLSYDATTVTNILERLREIAGEISKPFETLVSDAMRLSTAMRVFLEKFESVGDVLPNSIVSHLKKQVVWRGKAIINLFQNWHFNPLKNRVRVILAHYKAPYGRRSVSVCPRVFMHSKCETQIVRSWTDQSPIFVVQGPEEKSTYAGIRVANLVKERKQEVFWVKGGESEIKRLLVLLRRPEKFEVINIADLPTPVYDTGGGGSGVREKGKVTLRRFVSGTWKEEKVAVDHGGIAFFTDDREFRGVENPSVVVSSAINAAKVVQWLIAMKAIDPTDDVFLIPARARKSIKKGGDVWMCAVDYAVDAAKSGWTLEDANEEVGETHKTSIRQRLERSILSLVEETSKLGSVFKDGTQAHLMAEALKAVADAEEEKGEALIEEKQAARALSHSLGLRYNGTVPNDIALLEAAAFTAQEVFNTRYPMFSRAFYWSLGKSDLQLALDYINLVDNG